MAANCDNLLPVQRTPRHPRPGWHRLQTVLQWVKNVCLNYNPGRFEERCSPVASGARRGSKLSQG